jgi:hypothetical protein
MTHIYPVCGYPDLYEPAYKDIDLGSDEICPSCGYQFGCTDDALHITHAQWRTRWVAQGMMWDKGRSTPPPNWNPRIQAIEYRSVYLTHLCPVCGYPGAY